MADLNALFSRRSLFIGAWILLLASVFVPAPAGYFPVDAAAVSGVRFLGEDILGGTGGASGRWVLGQVIRWSMARPGSIDSLGYWHAAMLTLACFANIAFLFCVLLLSCPRVAPSCAIFLLAAAGIGASIAFLFPEFARLPAYWLWLASLVLLAVAFVPFRAVGAPLHGAPANRAAADAGKVPALVWAWLGFVIFWLVVTHLGMSRQIAPEGAETKGGAPVATALTSYFNDQADLVAPDRAAKFNVALAAFEQETSNQIAVAIYPRAPLGSIEEFTIATAERSRLGRKGLDNGAILFVFVRERSARLEVGYGLESVLTDVESHRILEATLVPAFEKGDYAGGLDAALGAIFETVQDAYKKDLMPSKFAVLLREVRVAMPKIAQQAVPTLAHLGMLPRIAIAFWGGLLGIGAWYGTRSIVRIVFSLLVLGRNIVSGRSADAGSERVSASSILEKLKLVGLALELVIGSAGFALAAIASVAGVVILAAGGGFGGAGTLLRW